MVIKYFFLSYIISFESTDQNDPDQNDRDRNVPDPNDRDRNVPDPNDRDQNDLDPTKIYFHSNRLKRHTWYTCPISRLIIIIVQ